MPTNDSSLISLLRTDLLEARKARDQLTSSTLQAIISAADNASAVPVPESINSIGVGSTEVPRQELSEQDVCEIIKREITELQHAINELGDAKDVYANELASRIDILRKYL